VQIIQQGETVLQLKDRKLNPLFTTILVAGFCMGISVWRVRASYAESQYIQLKCDVVPSTQSAPCTVSSQQPFTVTVESEPLRNIKIEKAFDDDGEVSRYTLILLTEKGDYTVHGLKNEEVQLYGQKIEEMLKFGQTPGSQLESLRIERDVRIWSFIWCVVWGTFGAMFIPVILLTPTSIIWEIDKEKNSILFDSYQFFRRISHDKIRLDNVKEIRWTLETKIHKHDDQETKTLIPRVALILRSGEAISLAPDLWSEYWQLEESKAIVIKISHFLGIEEPQLSDVTSPENFKQMQDHGAQLQEQAQLKKQRSDKSSQ
jgi:hypothetical protein